MFTLKRCIFTVGIQLLLIAAVLLGITAKAFGEADEGGLNLQNIKTGNTKVNTVIDQAAQKINSDNAKINQEANTIKNQAAAISKITTETKNTEKIINNDVKNQLPKSNITLNSISDSAASDGQVSVNQNGITVQIGASKQINIKTNINPIVTVKPVVNVKVVNKPKNNNISISVPVIKIISLHVNKPTSINIINNFISAIPVPIVLFKSVTISLPNLLGGNTNTIVKNQALANPDKPEVINKAVFAGLPQTGSIIDFNVLMINGCLFIFTGMIMLIAAKKCKTRKNSI